MRSIITSGFIGALVVLPFAVLEFLNTGGFAANGFPAALFGSMWLLAFVLVALLASIVRTAHGGERLLAHPASFLLKAGLLVIIVVMLAGIVDDQMPCFLGVPNCD